MKRIVIEIKREHIRAGKPGNPGCCPVALAMMAAGVSDPEVWGGIAFGGLPEKEQGFIDRQHKFYLPKLAQKFTTNFDTGKPVRVSRFRLTYEKVK